MGSILNNSMKIQLKNCPKCKHEFNSYSIWGSKKFCSRSCANSRGPRTIEFKETVSKKLTNRPSSNLGKLLVPRIDRACIGCKNTFEIKTTDNKKYCNNDCWKNYSGGYREGSGRSKSGYYQGIYCGSTYELCWVIHSIDHAIGFTRFSGVLESNELKYYPDFLLNDGKTIIETKGYESQESVDKKTALAESFGYIVKVLRREDLQYAFDYVIQKYGTPKYHTLYDGYKPKYNYNCGHCTTLFTRDKKLKTDTVFCSRYCAGKGHKGRTTSL